MSMVDRNTFVAVQWDGQNDKEISIFTGFPTAIRGTALYIDRVGSLLEVGIGDYVFFGKFGVQRWGSVSFEKRYRKIEDNEIGALYDIRKR